MSAGNSALIGKLYGAFAARDGNSMASLYAPDATFSDPVFVDLKNDEPGDMWRMLTSRATDLHIELISHEADEQSGKATWHADYTFTQTGRKVHNEVDAEFEFANGLILEHIDDFDFHRWSRQALGLPGLLLGGTSFLRKKVQRQARAGLDEFIANK